MACTLKRRTEWDLKSPILSDPEDFVCQRSRCPSLSPLGDSKFSPLLASTPVFPNTVPAPQPKKPRLSISDVPVTTSTLPTHFKKRLTFVDSDDDEPEAEAEDELQLPVRKMVKTEHNVPPVPRKPTEENVLFTHAQVEAIVGRLVQEREAQLREAYENKMAELLDTRKESLVKFTEEKLKKTSSDSSISYLS